MDTQSKIFLLATMFCYRSHHTSETLIQHKISAFCRSCHLFFFPLPLLPPPPLSFFKSSDLPWEGFYACSVCSHNYFYQHCYHRNQVIFFFPSSTVRVWTQCQTSLLLAIIFFQYLDRSFRKNKMCLHFQNVVFYFGLQIFRY